MSNATHGEKKGGRNLLLWLVGGGFFVLALIVFTWTELQEEPQRVEQGAAMYAATPLGSQVAQAAPPPPTIKGTRCPIMTEAGSTCEPTTAGTMLRRDPSANSSLYGYFWPGPNEKDEQGRPVYKEVTYYLRGKPVAHKEGIRPEKADAVWLVPNEPILIVYGLSPEPPTDS